MRRRLTLALGMAALALIPLAAAPAASAHTAIQRGTMAYLTYYNDAAHSYVVGHGTIDGCGTGQTSHTGTTTNYYTMRYANCPIF